MNNTYPSWNQDMAEEPGDIEKEALALALNRALDRKELHARLNTPKMGKFRKGWRKKQKNA